jgi:hypothetical protein
MTSLGLRVFGFVASYLLADASFEAAAASEGGKKKAFHHVVASTTAAVWIHASAHRSTRGLPRALALGCALGVVTSPLYVWLFDEEVWKGDGPKSFLQLSRLAATTSKDAGRA